MEELSIYAIKSHIIEFIKITLVRMSCDQKISNRDYGCTDKNEPLLYKTIMKNNLNIDFSIEQVVEMLIADDNFKLIELIRSMTKFRYEYEEEILNIDEEKYHEEIYELTHEILHYIISFVGLIQLYNLHGDSLQTFEDLLMEKLFYYD